MKGHRVTLAALSFANLMGTLPACRAEFVPVEFQARYTSAAPVIDGKLDEAIWSGAQNIEEFFAYQSGGAPPAAETRARVLWDDSHFYFAVEMSDLDIRSSCGLTGACTRDSALFQGDVIEFFLRERSDSTRYHEFEWSPRNDQFDARFDLVRFGAPGTSWDSGVGSAVDIRGTVDNPADTDDGWTIEASIPLADFELSTVQLGTQWTFTFARYDYFNVSGVPTERLMMSTRGDPTAPNGGVTHGFHTYEIYDVLTFAGPPGDYNQSGQIEAADYTVWRDSWGETGAALAADGNGDHEVNQADYDLWKTNFGATVSASVSIPEPSRLGSWFSAFVTLALIRRW